MKSPSGSRLVNSTRMTVVAGRLVYASDNKEKRRGLLGRRSMEDGEALVLPGCRQVHTFGMRFPIDVAFVDGNGVVVLTCGGLRPWRLTPVSWRSEAAIEMACGMLRRTGTAVGDELVVVTDTGHP